MAVTPLLLLAVCVCGVASLCNVTCWTDYVSVLNCSCAGEAAPARPVLVHVVCSDEGLNGSCEVTPPRSWCTMFPQALEEDASIGTICTATPRHYDDQGGGLSAGQSSTWELGDIVKAWPPARVQVTGSAGLYNITWASQNPEDCLEYRLRIRKRHAPSKEPAILDMLLVGRNHLTLDHSKLPPLTHLAAELQAKMCQGNVYEGPWSEWSDAAEWTTADTRQDASWEYSFLSIPLIAVLMLFIWIHKTFLQRKIQLVGVYPRPQHFFAPLYADYQGNFKEWVKPAFSEYDFARHTLVNMEKQYGVLRRCSGGEAEPGGAGLARLLQPDAILPPPPLALFPDFQASAQSDGHVSIHTVRLSGEEGSEEEVMSLRSIRTLSSSSGGGGEEAASDSEAELAELAEPGPPPLPPAEAEAERVSLASFASNSQSEDGYPHMDLDTIDSGFSECGSPGVADHHQKHGNSNYVKQWPTPEEAEGYAQDAQ